MGFQCLKIAVLGGLGVLLPATFSSAQEVKWLLPTAIQSNEEQETTPDRPQWRTPSGNPIARNAAGFESLKRSDRPVLPLFDLGTVVTTGFGGTVIKKPLLPKDAPKPDLSDPKYAFLNPNGTVAHLRSMDGLGFAPNAAEISRAPYDRLLARDIGQVFGIALDDEDYRNLYLTATSVFGLNIIGKDMDDDRLPDRLQYGDAAARWMPGQWGNDVSAGPGSIWKVDGETGQISLFANVTTNGKDNGGAGLGNIAFDVTHNQLFVSDRDTGLIHRFDLDGNALDVFDHGLDGVYAQDGDTTPEDVSNRADILSPRFDVENKDSWGLAAPERRTWGLAVHGGRLYYSVAKGPEIHSVALDKETGAFLDDVRFEVVVPRDLPGSEISDIVFSGDGAMVLAQRAPEQGDFAHENFARKARAAVMRYVLKDPKLTDGLWEWVEEPIVYPVGFAGRNQNAAGGVAVGPNYDEYGQWDANFCGATLWSTGEDLRLETSLQVSLEKTGQMLVDGVQAQPVRLNETNNTPPWSSYFADYDGKYSQTPPLAGHVGDVEVLGCRASGGNDEDYVTGTPTGDGWDYCTLFPENCPKPPEDEDPCMVAQMQTVCDPVSGTYKVYGFVKDSLGNGLDHYKAEGASPGIAGVPANNPIQIPLELQLGGFAPGQTAQVNLCGYRASEAGTGQPYPCCSITASVTTPNIACEKEGE